MTTLIADPLVAGVPVLDSDEPLVRLDWIAGTATGAGRFVRAGLAERLAAAQDLLPRGLGLFLSEGYRTGQDQQAIEDAYADQLRIENPGIDSSELRRLTSRFVAPLHVAPHVAGAAVDLTLADEHGRLLRMGTRIDATPEESGGACYFDAPGLEDEVRDNRALLASVLQSVGLVNYPTEWWHWSFGDRYWAHVTGVSQAFYGPVSA